MKSLYEKGKEKIDEGRLSSHKSRKKVGLDQLSQAKPTHNTNEEIADI